MKVAEIYESIDGECGHAGKLTTFLRLAGCNLSCPWCDTKEWQGDDGFEKAQDMSIDEVLEAVCSYGNKHLTITGGEPLMQGKDVFTLVRQMARKNVAVAVETNGSYFVGSFLALSNVSLCLDYKCPSSCFSSTMNLHNYPLLRAQDCVKFVVANVNDLKFALKAVENIPEAVPIYVSPVFGWRCGSILMDWLKAAKESWPRHNIRIQTQLHKILWSPETKGV